MCSSTSHNPLTSPLCKDDPASQPLTPRATQLLQRFIAFWLLLLHFFVCLPLAPLSYHIWPVGNNFSFLCTFVWLRCKTPNWWALKPEWAWNVCVKSRLMTCAVHILNVIVMTNDTFHRAILRFKPKCKRGWILISCASDSSINNRLSQYFWSKGIPNFNITIIHTKTH